MLKYLALFIFLFVSSFAQQNDLLKNLLAERRLLYSNWQEALDQKSGLFGNQTKTDLEEIISVLKQIIRKDNEILEALDKMQINDFQEITEKYNKLIEENEKLVTLKKTYEKRLNEEKEFQKLNHSQIQRIEGDRIFIGLLLIISFVLIMILFIKLKTSRKKVKSLEAIIKKND